MEGDPAFVTYLDPTVGVHLGPDSLVVGVLSDPISDLAAMRGSWESDRQAQGSDWLRTASPSPLLASRTTRVRAL